MARKLSLGWGVIGSAALLFAGCETGSNSRVPSTSNVNNPRSPVVARQNMPQPNFPTNSMPSSGFGTASGGGSPQSPSMTSGFQTPSSGFPTQNNQASIGATNNVPPGPQGFGTPATGNRSNVTVTQPSLPPTQPPAQFADPGISPISPPTPPALPLPPPN
jgi:hypothetical protein